MQDVHLAMLNLLSFSINNNSVQERALCAVYKSQTESYKELLTCAKLPMLYNRCLQDIATLMYKVKYGWHQGVYLSYLRSKAHNNA